MKFLKAFMVTSILALFAGQPAVASVDWRAIKAVFVIAMENHNFTQPVTVTSPPQILGNPAAPYINSLITPGNTSAAQVSYALHYYNAGTGVHPSEPNYIWAEAGTDFGFDNDADPSTNNGNLFTAPHLTTQLNAAGIEWKNYEENVSLSAGPQFSASGFSAELTNLFYGTGDYVYAPKHNPMAFFSDTAAQNVFELTNLFADLTTSQVGRYNWITPNLYNDGHDALPEGFTYLGVNYTGEAAAVAQSDHFLAVIVPRIMASTAYQDHGVIILWWDEAEAGDTTNFTIPEIIISPLSRGNAYASSVEFNHSSDLKTMAEIFGLDYLSNSIPDDHMNVKGSGYNDVARVNDFRDLFKEVVINEPSWLGTNGFRFTFSGPAGESYKVLAADAVNLPLTEWKVLSNGVFSGGNDAFTDAQAGGYATRFYLIQTD